MKPTTMSAGVCLAGALALLPCPVAAEFVSFYTTIPIEPGCEAPDFDGDNRVGSTDLLDLLANWTES